MSTQHRIPMTPENLPQQRLVPVVTLPDLPPGVDIHVVYLRPAAMGDLPDRPGRESRYLASIEWAWSPMHSRQDHYYLSRERDRWCLWNCYQESIDSLDFDAEAGYLSLQPEWYLLCWCAGDGLIARQVALQLLRAFLEDERCGESVDRFHFVAGEGMLTTRDLVAVARAVWTDQQGRSS